MRANDDIRDLLGRYATGSLSSAERERLFDAALSDQDLFEELAREQELKLLLDEPGARDRLIHALEPPSGRTAWIPAAGIAAALSVVLVAYLLRPGAKPPQVAVMTTIPAPSAVAPLEPPPPEIAKSEAKPGGVPQAVKTKAEDRKSEPPVGQPVVDQATDEKAPVAVAATSPASPQRIQAMAGRAKQFVPQQQSAGGPRQNQVAQQSQVTVSGSTVSEFGFHYSVETKGHLIVVPAADGYLFVKGGDGSTLFERKQIAAAITVDIPVPAAVSSVTIAFSVDADPVESTPASRDAPSGTVEGSRSLAVDVKIK